MPLLRRKSVFAAKVEATVGTAEALTGAEGAFNARQMMYVKKTRGTAYDGFVYGSPGNQFDWVLGAVEDHCEDCPVWASGGPYDVSTLAIYPSGGDTQCLTSCLCFLRRDDGVVGPMPFGVTP